MGPGHLPELDRQARLDIRAANRELGYRPRWGLARGIDDYAEWLVADAGACGTPVIDRRRAGDSPDSSAADRS